MKVDTLSYLDKIIKISLPYYNEIFSKGRLEEFLNKISFLRDQTDKKKIIKEYSKIYINFIKEDYQRLYQMTNDKLVSFLEKQDDGIKLIGVIA